MLQNNTLALLLIVLCCGCDGGLSSNNNQCLALLLIVLCCGGWQNGNAFGGQQIGSLISCDEIDILLFFRDPISRKESEPTEQNLLRLCDDHNIPVATNIATAEALIMALERGDLDWRIMGELEV